MQVRAPGGSLSSGGRAWRWGCATVILLPIAVVLALLVSFRLGLFDERLARVRERYPWIDVVMAIKQAASEASSPSAASRGKTEAPRGRTAGVNDRRALPGDVVVHPRSTAETYDINGSSVAAFQRLSGDHRQMAAYLRKEVALRSWNVVTDKPIERGTMLIWSKGERSCKAELIAEQGGSELWLRCRADPARPGRASAANAVR